MNYHTKLQEELRNLHFKNTLTDASSIEESIQQEFLFEYKRLLGLILELEELDDKKAKRLLTVTQRLKELTSHGSDSAVVIGEVKNIINDIASENYSIWAETYNALIFFSEVKTWKIELKRIVKFISDNATDESDVTILDVGTGTGFPSLILPRMYRNAKVYAVDNSNAMLSKAKEFEKIVPWMSDNDTTITGLMQSYLDKFGYAITKPNKIQFYHSPTVPLSENTVDLAVMATAIPSYTSYTYELIESIYRALKPGGKALINFSPVSMSRAILLIRDHGIRKGLEIIQKPAHMDIILETTDSGKKVFSMKINYSKKACEKILTDIGFTILKKRSLFPLLYFMLSISRRAGYDDKRRIRSPYMYYDFPKNVFQKLWYSLICDIDGFLANWQLPTAYEYWYEVEKPLT